MSKDVRRHVLIVWGTTFLGAAPGAPAIAGEAARTTWTSYLYQGPSYRYAVVDEVPQTSIVDVASCSHGWCKVTFGGRIGYLRANVVSQGKLAEPAPGVLAQPAAAVSPDPPPGPCFKANQTGGNGGDAMTIFCRK